MTHYIPAFTTQNADGQQEAVCGQFVTAADHSTRPECPGCADYLGATAAVARGDIAPSSLRVLLPIGEDTYPRCEADLFSADVLTITAQDTAHIMRTYPPDQWLKVTCYDDQGYPRYTHFNSRYNARLAAVIAEAKQALHETSR